MEQDRHLKKLIREHGLESVPGNFTSRVMDRIQGESVRKEYKPLLGKSTGIIILVVFLAIFVVSIVFNEPSGQQAEGIFNMPQLNLPQLNLPEWNRSRLDHLLKNLPDINVNKGILTALAAVFILVISDELLSRRKQIT